MVPGIVHDDAHAAAVDLAHQSQEQAVGGGPAPGGRIDGILGRHAGLVAPRVGAEVAVDVVVVPGVVLVQRRRVVHRIEIQGGDAEVLEIVQPVHDALQVAAVAAELHGAVEVLAGGRRPRAPADTSPATTASAATRPAAARRSRPRCRARSGSFDGSPFRKRSTKIWYQIASPDQAGTSSRAAGGSRDFPGAQARMRNRQSRGRRTEASLGGDEEERWLGNHRSPPVRTPARVHRFRSFPGCLAPLRFGGSGSGLVVWPVFKTAMELPLAAPVGSIPTRSRHSLLS